MEEEEREVRGSCVQMEEEEREGEGEVCADGGIWVGVCMVRKKGCASNLVPCRGQFCLELLVFPFQ